MSAPDLRTPDLGAPDLSAPDLSALVSARLCHDLISPMGAIGNGLELLQMSQTGPSAEFDLISGSVESALAKLRFYRLAFGPADDLARQSFDEARAITDAMFQGRFSVVWSVEGRDMPRTTARLLYLALLCLEKSLPMGGAVQVAISERTIALAVEGKRTAPPEALWRLVTDGHPPEALHADGVQFALLRRALEETDRRIEVAFTQTGAKLTLSPEAVTPA